MLFLKTYCYSKHELPFVIANLIEGYDYIDKMYLYEYNYTHTGIKKEYEMEKVLNEIPDALKCKLEYRKVDLSDVIEYAYENENVIHSINEPLQRSYFFNDENVVLNDSDIIIDHDVDEIIYRSSYSQLIDELHSFKCPLSIKLNQFFFKHMYLWTDCIFSSPTIYTYYMVKNNIQMIKGKKIQSLRDLSNKTKGIYGCHMSWVMPIDNMIIKLHSYSHPKYRKFADKNVLQHAIETKQYIFDTRRKFTIEVLDIKDPMIPSYLQKEVIF